MAEIKTTYLKGLAVTNADVENASIKIIIAKEEMPGATTYNEILTSKGVYIGNSMLEPNYLNSSAELFVLQPTLTPITIENVKEYLEFSTNTRQKTEQILATINNIAEGNKNVKAKQNVSKSR